MLCFSYRKIADLQAQSAPACRSAIFEALSEVSTPYHPQAHVMSSVSCISAKQHAPCSSVCRHEKAYSTWYSQAVSHPSTNQARPCLASEIGRDRACSGWYGRKQGHRWPVRPIYIRWQGQAVDEKLTAPGIPRRSPIQVLTRPYPA